MVDVSELAKTEQVLRTVNQKLSMSLDVANVTPWKWDLVQHTILCDVNKAVNVNFSGLFDENQLTVPDTEYFSKIYKERREKVRKAYESLILGKVNKIRRNTGSIIRIKDCTGWSGWKLAPPWRKRMRTGNLSRWLVLP